MPRIKDYITQTPLRLGETVTVFYQDVSRNVNAWKDEVLLFSYNVPFGMVM